MSEGQPNWMWRYQFLLNEAKRLEAKADTIRKEAADLRELARRINPTSA